MMMTMTMTMTMTMMTMTMTMAMTMTMTQQAFFSKGCNTSSGYNVEGGCCHTSSGYNVEVGRTDRPWRAYPRLSAAPPGQAFENHRRVAAASAADAAGGMAPP